jgi:hypothetical protein
MTGHLSTGPQTHRRREHVVTPSVNTPKSSVRHSYTDTDAQAQVLSCPVRHVYESYAL